MVCAPTTATECKNPHFYFKISPLCPSKGPIDMQDRGLKEHLHRSLSAQISNTAQTACLSSPAKHPGTKVSSINRDGLLFQPRDTDGEALVFSTPPEPAAHPRAAICVCQGPLPVPLIEYSEY